MTDFDFHPLRGRTAFITGASRGIGAAIARELQRQGARVAFTFKQSGSAAAALAEQLSAPGREALAIQADSSDPAAVEAAVDRVGREFGRVDILVNNAGVFGLGSIEDGGVAEAQRLLSVHVLAVVAATRAALPYMASGGRIVSIGSCLAERVPAAGMSLYAMSKSALQGLTQGLARDLGPAGITVNVVQPGPVDTDMNPANGPMAAGMIPFLAIGRYGHPDEVASFVAYLAGPEAGNITGASLMIDGGFAA